MKQQFFPLEIKGKFYLTHPKQKTPSPIVFIVRLGGKQVKFHTGVKVYPDQWNPLLQYAYISPILSNVDNQNNETVNTTIDEIKFRFSEYKKYICNKNNELDFITQLKFTLKGMARKKKSNVIEDIIAVIRRAVINDTTIGGATSKNYINKGLPALKFYLDYYEEENKSKVNDFHIFTTEFFNKFSLYIYNNYLNDGEPYTVSTINSILKYAKSAVVLCARAEGFLSELEISAIKLRLFDDKSSDNHIALRNDEIMKLYRYQCESEKDELVRDMFLLECTLGHRISDILIIDERIDKIDGNYYISIAPTKTPNKRIDVGIIFQIAKQILIDKYNCKLPECSKDKINREIKRIAKNAGIEGEELQSIHYVGSSQPEEFKKPRYECIATHTGRRTFVSLLSARGWTYEKISKYTAQSIKMVEHYDKATAKYIDVYRSTLDNHPEDIVRLISDTKLKNIEITPLNNTNNSINQLNSVIELAKESERQKITIEQLTQTITEAEKTAKQIKNSVGIDMQIANIKEKATKEKAELLEILIKMGFTYDDYLKYQKEISEQEREIDIADSHHDTILDD
ncbi:MAG: hypothetical protein K2I94_05150 [Muribaculaceae bacterium]|nr:hypothetical protein [Muribaculaceae bacterium]